MLKRICLFLLCFGLHNILPAQFFSLKGKVTDAATGKPLAGASVFLSNTSYGAESGSDGGFELRGISQGKYDFVVSYVGYETFAETVSEKNTSDFITIKMQQKSEELKDVVVKSFDPDGWQKWGKFFIENFIGTSAFAQKCTFKNTTAVKFHFSKTKNILTAFATEPLIIENKALGYTIKYQLEDFSYNYTERSLFYAGYPFFEEMPGNKNQEKRWLKARSDAYELSLMHFMRSLFRNKLIENGYQLYRLEKIPNLEKERLEDSAKAYYKINLPTANGNFVSYESTIKDKDSFYYYNKIMNEKDPVEIIHPQLLTGDSIAYAADSITAALDFQDYLIVRYPEKNVPPEYAATDMNISTKQPVSSTLYLINKKTVMVTGNGYYYDVEDLLADGFWGWWEKISTMLPFNYSPGNK